MARTKKVNPVVPEEQSPKDKILQEITNRCVTIGDKSFLIRQTKTEIQGLYAQIDKLRGDLIALAAQESTGGSQGA
jgi:hypothetical protein